MVSNHHKSIGRVLRLQVAVVNPLGSAVLLLPLLLLLDLPVHRLPDVLGQTRLLLQIHLKRTLKTVVQSPSPYLHLHEGVLGLRARFTSVLNKDV